MITRLSLAAAATLALATPAAALTLDFDTGTPTFTGVNTLTGYTQGGLSFDVTFTANGPLTVSANFFDTGTDGSCPATSACSPGDDLDLLPAGGPGTDGIRGNVLILQDANAATGPGGDPLDDDSGDGGTITLTLTAGPAFSLLGFSAVDDGTFDLYLGVDTAGTLLASLAPGADSASASTSFAASALIGVGESFTIDYHGASGGVDSLVLAPVPLPAGAVLLMGGLAGFAGLRRSKRWAAT